MGVNRSRVCAYCRPAMLALALLQGLVPAVAMAQSTPGVPPWTARIGVTFPRVRPADDAVADPADPSKTSGLTFPRLTVARAVGPVDFEVGYRKLGVWHYEGAAKGHTHSNAGQLTVAWRAPAARGWAFGVRGGVQLVRTVTIVSTAPASWPIRSGVNAFQWRPVAAATASYDITPHWGVAAEWEPVLGVLGRRGVSDRYRQQLFGLDLVYRR